MTWTIVLDVNETLSDMRPLGARFEDVGLTRDDMPLWFSGVLRDGFASSMMGRPTRFADLAIQGLRARLADTGLRDADDAVSHVLEGFASLGVHPDVPGGLRRLHEAGHRLLALTNGASAFAEGLLARAGVTDVIEAYLSVDDAAAWKPDQRAYAHAIQFADVPARSMLMVATHAWDTAGASAAGMRSAWLSRGQPSFPAHFLTPDYVVTDVEALADAL